MKKSVYSHSGHGKGYGGDPAAKNAEYTNSKILYHKE